MPDVAPRRHRLISRMIRGSSSVTRAEAAIACSARRLSSSCSRSSAPRCNRLQRIDRLGQLCAFVAHDVALLPRIIREIERASEGDVERPTQP